MNRSYFIVGLLISILPCVASGATYIVTPDGSGSFPTIQSALDAAVDGDVIELGDGVFAGDGNRDIDFQGKQVTMTSRSGNPNLSIIDCQGTLLVPHRGFLFENGEGRDTIVEGITIRNGTAGAAEGGFYRGGGAVWCRGNSSPTFFRCKFSACEGREGGGLFTQGSEPSFVDCLFESNRAHSGGAVYCMGLKPRFVQTRFENNVASLQGGVAYFLHSKGAEFIGCEFVGNRSEHSGGVVAQGESCFSNNLLLEHCLFLENTCRYQGGALLLNGFYDSETRVAYCTFYANGSDYYSTVNMIRGSLVIENSILSYSSQGAAVDYWGSESTVAIECTDIYGNEGGDWVGPISTMLGESGNIALDPRFCEPLAGEFRLSADSPCDDRDCGIIGAYDIGCESSSIGDDVALDVGLQIVAVSPNPFSSAVTVDVLLSDAHPTRDFRASIFDAQGRLVREFAGLSSNPGELIWDGTDSRGKSVATGVYFLRVPGADIADYRSIRLVRAP